MIAGGTVTRARWLVDLTFVRRCPQLAARIREAFGDDAIRVTRNHAKFAIVHNDTWNVVCRTSMNLNHNPRLEDFTVAHDPELAAFLLAMLVTTGLRKGELAALTVDDVRLDEARPVVVLPGADAKNGQRATLPLRSDIAEELGRWMTERAERDGGEPRGAAASPTRRGGAKLFTVPTGLVRILDRDLHAAGIPKRDDRGRTVDVHAMRHTFASHLVAAGVAPRVAQAALRHSSLELTMQHYTDPRLLDVAGALAALPALSAAETKAMPEAEADGAVAPTVALTSDRPSQNKAAGVHRGSTAREARTTRKPLKTCVVPAKTEKRAKGLEPSTSSLGS
ncbi:MAG: site-specific integrase [Planctomycetota bacterium]